MHTLYMRKSLKEENILIVKTTEFAIDTVKFCETLNKDKRWDISRQLLRSGTSIAANSRESQNAESVRDFIHKLKIAAKEANETEFWIELIEACYEKYDVEELKIKIEEVSRILNAIIATTKKKLANS